MGAHDALDGFTALRRQGEVGQPNYEVRHRTAEVVTTRHRKWRLRTGEMVKERRDPDQTATQTRTYRNGVSITTLPDGSKSTRARRPDPRFGLMAGFGGVGRLERPGGQIGESSSTRAVSLSNPDDPFSVDGLTHTSTVEGRTSTLAYTGVTRRFTSSSPEGRSATIDIDERGRVIGAAAPQIEPLTVDYEPTGEVDKVMLGDDPKTRRITDYAYDALRRLDAVTDAEGFTVFYDYDAANRVDTVTLSDLKTIVFDYDAMGNVLSITPPGRPAHTFTYTKRNQLDTYTLPDVKGQSGPAVESRFYDRDRRLGRLVRPDGLVASNARLLLHVVKEAA